MVFLIAAGPAAGDGGEGGGGEGGGGGSGPGARLLTLLLLLRNLGLSVIAIITVLAVLASLGVDIGPLLAGAGIPIAGAVQSLINAPVSPTGGARPT